MTLPAVDKPVPVVSRLRIPNIALITFFGTLVLMGFAAVAAFRSAPTAVPCGNQYSLTATGTLYNWTSAPWAITTSTGPTSSYPGQTATNDCATVGDKVQVDLTSAINQLAGMSITQTSTSGPTPAYNLRIGAPGEGLLPPSGLDQRFHVIELALQRPASRAPLRESAYG